MYINQFHKYSAQLNWIELNWTELCWADFNQNQNECKFLKLILISYFNKLTYFKYN